MLSFVLIYLQLGKVLVKYIHCEESGITQNLNFKVLVKLLDHFHNTMYIIFNSEVVIGFFKVTWPSSWLMSRIEITENYLPQRWQVFGRLRAQNSSCYGCKNATCQIFFIDYCRPEKKGSFFTEEQKNLMTTSHKNFVACHLVHAHDL